MGKSKTATNTNQIDSIAFKNKKGEIYMKNLLNTKVKEMVSVKFLLANLCFF